jgi:hypothetical protein
VFGLEPGQFLDPKRTVAMLWPHARFYRQQWDMIYSVLENDETICAAGNMLGKDFTAGFIATYFFLSRNPCRIVTSSAKDDHLRVLWGEINRWIDSCKYPLHWKQGGPFVVNHQDVRRVDPVTGRKDPISYMIGMVVSPDTEAAMQGHHVAKTGDGIPRTLFVADECSSVPDAYWKLARTWANRMLGIGNTWPCNNFFYRAVEGQPGGKDPGGDLPRPAGDGLYRKVIRIRASDSPNVRLAMGELGQGKRPSGLMVIPGVKDYYEYKKNLDTMDPAERSVVLDAEFFKGGEVRLFPREWLDHSRSLGEAYAERVKNRRMNRTAKAIGCDPAEGGDKTAWAVVDEHGLLELVSRKTPDTTAVTRTTTELIKKWGVRPESVAFDRGGGGKQHADRLRDEGYPVTTVGFGDGVSPDPSRHRAYVSDRLDAKESRYAYKNRRAELYADLSDLLDPQGPRGGFAIPDHAQAIFNQLIPIPKLRDQEGRLYLPPKHKPPTAQGKSVTCLVDLIGHSPDEADALVLAVHAMLGKARKPTAGILGD